MIRQDLTRTALAIAVLGVLTGAPATFAQGTPSKGPAASKASGSTQLSASDKKFMETAADAGMTEVEAGKLAQSKASSADVKSFGSRMVDDHTKANDKLKAIAGEKNVTLPSGPSKAHQAALDKLDKSKNFDKDFSAMMVKDHKEAVSLFQKESKSKDSDLSGFASSTLPTLQDHLKMAQDLGKAGATKK
jgi:putative membrane protein